MATQVKQRKEVVINISYLAPPYAESAELNVAEEQKGGDTHSRVSFKKGFVMSADHGTTTTKAKADEKVTFV